MVCKICETAISTARLAQIPDATLCTDCQSQDDVPKMTGYMSWSHKTAPEIIIGPAADILRQYDRKGVHAQLPIVNRENIFIQHGELRREAVTAAREPVLMKVVASVRTEPSRCHPGRPKVTPDGSCTECAIEWYRRRLR